MHALEARRVTDLRKVFTYLMFLLTWLRSRGEIALLHAEDLRYFWRSRKQRFNPERYHSIADFSSADTDVWFCCTPHQLQLLLTHWRVPPTFRYPGNGQVFTGEACLVIFHFHLIQGTAFRAMARHPFGGEPRHFSFVFDLKANHLYFTFYNKITGTSLSQWLPPTCHTPQGRWNCNPTIVSILILLSQTFTPYSPRTWRTTTLPAVSLIKVTVTGQNQLSMGCVGQDSQRRTHAATRARCTRFNS